MTEIEILQVEVLKLKLAKTKACKQQHFELAATLNDREKELKLKIKELVAEVQSVLKNADKIFNMSI